MEEYGTQTYKQWGAGRFKLLKDLLLLQEESYQGLLVTMGKLDSVEVT